MRVFIEVLYLSICLLCLQTCSAQSRDYSHMIMDLQGSVFVAGRNRIYQFNSSDLHEEVTSLTVGPYNNTDVYITQLYFRPGSSSRSADLMFCISSDYSCYFSDPNDISDYENGTLNISSVHAAAVFGERAWYLACPHQDVYYKEGYSPCSDPGIFKMSAQTQVPYDVKFKKKDLNENVKTQRFIRGLEFGNSKLFFSIQGMGNHKTSHVSHICESTSQILNTYIDMPITCGDNNILIDVKKESNWFVASFTNRQKQGSTVCIYSIVQTKKRLIENMEKCYRKQYQYNTDSDYIKGTRCNTNPQNDTINLLISRPESVILCNTDDFHRTYYGVIGDITLDAQPALEFKDQVIHSITLSQRGDLFAGFFGSIGWISKAVIYPRNKTAEKLRTVYPVDGLQPGQLLNDGTSLYALTRSEILEFPMSNCTSKMTCGECLGDPDPDCGWCILGNMCTSQKDCEDHQIWLKASNKNPTERCPKVTEIQPNIINVKDSEQNLTIKISPSIDVSNQIKLTCLFKSNQSGISFTKREPAIGGSGELQCQEPGLEVKNLQDSIKGTLNVEVSVYLDVSDRPLVTSIITYYNCKTFTRCMQCVNTGMSCDWCPYGSRCVNRGRECSSTPNMKINATETCPSTEVYTFDDKGLGSENESLVLSQDIYKITVQGKNFLRISSGSQYSCVTKIQGDVSFRAIYVNSSTLECRINLTNQGIGSGTLSTNIAVKFGQSYLDGIEKRVIFYDCGSLISPRDNCGECQSFQHYGPQYRCKWCGGVCQYTNKTCQGVSNGICPPPVIQNVAPMTAFVNATTRVDINGYNLGSHYNETVGTVNIAGLPCSSIENLYIPSKRISCMVGPADGPTQGPVTVSLGDGVASGFPGQEFAFKIPQLTSICPTFGPRSGGTRLYVYGTDLDIGRNKLATVAGLVCNPVECVKNSSCYRNRMSASFCCETCSASKSLVNVPQNFEMSFDNQTLQGSDVMYEYAPDPIIETITPRESFADGGRTLTITGQNLLVVQEPKIYLRFSNNRRRVVSFPCIKNETVNRPGTQKIYCPSPPLRNRGGKSRRRGKRSIAKTIIAFEMDGVQEVKHLSEDMASVTYFNNPTIKKFITPEQYQKVMIIEGENLNAAATVDDVLVWIGSKIKCNVTLLEMTRIYFNPPVTPPFPVTSQNAHFLIQVDIGYFREDVGYIVYGSDGGTSDSETAAIIGGVVAFCVVLVAFIVALIIYLRKRKKWGKEKRSMEYMMEMKEAKFREHCRKEFAGLQTAMSDLTGDLAGGNVLFRDYNVYATHILFMSNKDHVIMKPPQVMTEYSNQAMDTFKGLLRNTQFLLVLIRTLDKEKRFTIQDKSNVASILMALNHDNMEYITGILKTLLNDLVDKNVAAMSEKLLLRRSECVAEKLLTHWLSICLYDYLKERAGTPLFQLYKAMKVQIERGPVDYISGCAKFTLSEDKLLAEDINPNPLTIQVTHEDYLENTEKTITITVLDCDTITQTKSKMLEVFYKNVGYSQRPLVHSTNIEWLQEDSTSRVLSDEDPSSIKDGIWKRINTLEYYGVQDGAKMRLVHSRKENVDDLLQTGATKGNPYAFIGSFKRTKQVVRTVSGSNFWHLAKQHQADEEEGNPTSVKIASDILLPRLIVTKGILQSYVDDLFTEILSVSQDPPIIVKYLYDFLDSAAEERNITDPEVLHTWKCNSLLLRFWVNIMKNPEFVFDIFKPHIVDKCLSVIAQAFMDSCSTADIKLGDSSPSNKLLFNKDIPGYKTRVKEYFQYVKDKPVISDQELNSFLTEKVSGKFSGDFHQSSALMEMYKYASTHRNAILNELDNLEAESPGHYSPMTSKLQLVYMMMDREGGASK